MAKVIAKYPGEPVDAMVRRFKKKVIKEGILDAMKKHEFYESPSVAKKKKQAQARRLAMQKAEKYSSKY